MGYKIVVYFICTAKPKSNDYDLGSNRFVKVDGLINIVETLITSKPSELF